MRIIIFSPHLDDAVLSCFDHIQSLASKKHSINIVNVFTSFSTPVLSNDASDYLKRCNYSDIRTFEKARKHEDSVAMNYLPHITTTYLGYTDGGFRSWKGKPVYENYSKLFNGNISSHDSVIYQSVVTVFKKYRKNDLIYIPYGLGNHADHLLVRNAALEVFDRSILRFYVDMPYFLWFNKIKKTEYLKLLLKFKSIKLQTQNKKLAIQSYTSQIPLLFSKSIYCPEIITTVS